MIIKGVRLMTQHEYKNPPVPRRYVGQRPPNLFLAYTDPISTVSGTRLDNKYGKINLFHKSMVFDFIGYHS